MRYCFIANPHARNGRAAEQLTKLRTELARYGVTYDLVFCQPSVGIL